MIFKHIEHEDAPVFEVRIDELDHSKIKNIKNN